MLESFRSAWTIILFHNVGMKPFLQLQDLDHVRQKTHTPLLRGRKNGVSFNIRHKTAKLEYMRTFRIFQRDPQLLICIKGWNRLSSTTQKKFFRILGYKFVILPIAFIYWKDESRFVIWIFCKVAVISLSVRIHVWAIAIVKSARESVDVRVRQLGARRETKYLDYHCPVSYRSI